MKIQITNYKLQILTSYALLLLAVVSSSAQVASHGPSALKNDVSVAAAASPIDPKLMRPVARVNGAVLTELDLVREMYAIFPYARQHNGFPKGMEAEIRQGALQMIIFEELLYQEAKRRNLTVAPARVTQAEANFRKQFPRDAEFRQYLQAEHNGSTPALREKVRRSLLIEQMLKTEVKAKSRVTLAMAKEFYDKNPKRFTHSESFNIQTISIIPPPGASADILKEARKRADEALRKAKATKSYEEFGLLAEKMSDDDWHVNMGDRKTIEAAKLPPPIVKVARAMKPGQVSDLIQLGNAYTLIRINAHTSAGKTPFPEVKAKLQADMEKEKTEQVRAALGKKLRQNANVEIL